MITWAMVIAVLKGVQKVITHPMVDKAVDHYVAGTANKIDDQVWQALEWLAHLDDASFSDHKPQIESAIAGRQAWYESLEEDAKENYKQMATVQTTPFYSMA